MTSSTDGYKETKAAKDFQEWIEINKSRHDNLYQDQLSTSSLSSSSSHELINQCGKGLNGGIAGNGKKVRFKKKLRRAKDHNLSYRNGYFRGEDKRAPRPNHFCHLVKLLSTFGGLAVLLVLIFVVVNVQTRLDILSMQLHSLSDHYHATEMSLASLRSRIQDNDQLIATLSSNLSAYRNRSKLAFDGGDHPSRIVNSSLSLGKPNPVNGKVAADLSWLPIRVIELSAQLKNLTVHLNHCNVKLVSLEETVNSSSSAIEGLTKTFTYLNNALTENSGKLEHLMGIAGHLVQLTEHLNLTRAHDDH